MAFHKDQLNRVIELKRPPVRIVSLVPSQTELLYDLGLEEEVAGITKFCVHPDQWFRTKTRVGGTKQLHLDVIDAIKPDLIIANKEENAREQIEELARRFPVWISDVHDLDDALGMIKAIGAMTGREQQAVQIRGQILNEFSRLKPDRLFPRTCYLIWKDPYMTVGHDSFIANMMQWAGFENLFAGATRYPQTTVEELRALDCRLLLLSSEPFPFSRKHVDELQPLLPGTRIVLVDGEMFSWYGSRLLKSASYLEHLQNQVLSLPDASGIEPAV